MTANSVGGAPLRIERQRLESAVAFYVEQCIANRTSPRVSELAAIVGVSRRRVTTLFRRAFDCSARELMLRLQLAEAERLLGQTALTVREIAIRAGFGTSRTFHSAFKAARGITPEEFRRGFL
jgi:AraC-like DNA-binding protein